MLKIYVGKKAADHTLSQDKIIDLLIAKAKEGKTVVRLKGGDPFVFGRGGEESRALHDAGLPFEIIPGVTSAIGAPAYAGIPVTDRTAASSLPSSQATKTRPRAIHRFTGTNWRRP